ncbi:MAG: efflux RND transporter periplasmic adaptor subunit [Firmicutes bacterium]|nr:efflux RND transporter periplasmic adaptor subunit [Bacillota bacterium]
MITLIGLLSGCSEKQNKEEGKKENYIPVEVGKIETKTISNEVTYSGKVHADKDVLVMPKIMGKISNVYVSVGEEVKKGEKLFTLDKEDIQKRVDQAKVALNQAKANYEMTKEKIENAKTSFERTKKLYEEGAVSKAQYEQAKVQASDSSLEAAKGGVNQAQVQYDQALDSLDNTSIEAPISGKVASVNIEAGEFATTSQPSMTIVDTDKVYVQINVTENIINELFKGKGVKVDIESASSKDILGKIDSVSPAPDSRTQMYPVKIYMENNNGLIKPGMFAQVRLDTNIKNNTMVVKSEAVVEENGEKVVFIISDNIAKLRKVNVGLDTGEYIEILGGLKGNEKLIIKGQNYVEDGSKVKVVRGDK